MNPVLANLVAITAPLCFVPSLGALNIAAYQGDPSSVIAAFSTALEDRRFVVGKARADLIAMISDVEAWAGIDQRQAA